MGWEYCMGKEKSVGCGRLGTREWRLENGNLAGSTVLQPRGLITPSSHYHITLLNMHSGRGASHLFPRCSFSTTLKAITSENE